MNAIVPFEYQGHPVKFTTDGWINATEIAKRFGKKPNDWLRLDETKAYLEILAEHFNCEPDSLLKTRRGRHVSGTWLHPKLAVAFARWLDMRFSVWCDLRIDAMLRGEVSIKQQFDQACKALDDRRDMASEQGRGLSQWRFEKPPLESRVEYWRRELQLSLPLPGGES